ncbi:MAG: hypothetical protein N0E59_22530, partial [Candidatus Thiodiazotropha taylori]|nr:hypothetical protein [Candidatus Thiodiazotropha taylori]MCW4285896.1 hypothetical protein [Candidatus Thiodiazotropha taylori]
MSKLVFMGHVLSARGIGPAEVKVQAVQKAREPESAAEVKSFLGLVACLYPKPQFFVSGFH